MQQTQINKCIAVVHDVRHVTVCHKDFNRLMYKFIGLSITMNLSDESFKTVHFF